MSRNATQNADMQLREIILKTVHEVIAEPDEKIGPSSTLNQLVEQLRPLSDLVVERTIERLKTEGIPVPSALNAIVEELCCPQLSDIQPVPLLSLEYQHRRLVRNENAMRAKHELELRRLNNLNLGAERLSQTSLSARFIVK